MAELLTKEIIAASYRIGIHTDTVTKMIENTRKSMEVDSHITFVNEKRMLANTINMKNMAN